MKIIISTVTTGNENQSMDQFRTEPHFAMKDSIKSRFSLLNCRPGISKLVNLELLVFRASHNG